MARVLVIDDDRSLLQMMTIMLEKAGHTPILAASGEEGIDLAIKERPDIAIVDVMMPEISGYDVCRRLRADPRTMTIPLLILTARSQPMDREMAAEAGADDFVTKPVTRDDLITHMEALLVSGATNIPTTPPQPEAPRAAPQPTTTPITAVFTQLPLVAVMGLRNGVGTTTIAVNLGLGLMQHGRVCVVDLNTTSGQVAVQLRLSPPATTWLNLIDATDRPDKRRVGSSLMMHHSGVAVMAAPLGPVQERLPSETLHYVYTVLLEAFPRIVIDLPASLDAMATATLQDARHIVLVAGDDPASLATAPQALKAVEGTGCLGTQHIILNRTRPHGLPSHEVANALGRPLAAEVPYEPAQVDALGQGIPLVMSQPGSLFSRAILNLARAL